MVSAMQCIRNVRFLNLSFKGKLFFIQHRMDVAPWCNKWIGLGLGLGTLGGYIWAYGYRTICICTIFQTGTTLETITSQGTSNTDNKKPHSDQ